MSSLRIWDCRLTHQGPKPNCCRHTHTQTETCLSCATAMIDALNKGRNQQINIWAGDPRVRRSYAAARVQLCECERHHHANHTLRDQNLSFWVATSVCCSNHTTVITLSSWSGRTRPHRRLWLCANWLSFATMWSETWPEGLNYSEERESLWPIICLN